MKSIKLLLLFANVAMLAASVPASSAQVGGNDWEPTGITSHVTWTDGTVHQYKILYSPATVTHNGQVVSVTVDMVYTDSSPIVFFEEQVNCAAQTHQGARYDISSDPAKLGAFSGWAAMSPGTVGALLGTFFCK